MQLRKREKQAKKGIKIQALLADNVNNIFERNLNSFLELHKKNSVRRVAHRAMISFLFCNYNL